VWLTLAASMRTAAVLTDAQATGLAADLLTAQGATEPTRPGVAQPRRDDR